VRIPRSYLVLAEDKYVLVTQRELLLDIEAFSKYGLIRQEILHVAISTLPWAVQLRKSYDTTSNIYGRVSESDLAVLTNTPINQDLSDYACPDV
jgi:hypothetical protein